MTNKSREMNILDNQDTPVKVIKDKYVPLMFRLQWSNGDLSSDYYNETRANDILNNYFAYKDNTHRRKPLKRPARVPRSLTGKTLQVGS